MKYVLPFLIGLLLASVNLPIYAQGSPDPSVLDTEAERVAVMARATQAAVAIFEGSGQGGGSGIIISPDGFALTNFHVTAPCGAAMKCGLSDGQLYDAVIVGIDPVGDVALIQLLGRDDFPVAEIGDSDTVRVGDWAFAVGNPFLLADDFKPSVSYGMISGVHRYQYPSGTLLEYADCIQTDAAVNPGNSGGALFNAQGQLIGINGRCSFEKRGRVNVGVGYAISINQIQRFVSHLKAGRITDHASLGFTVSTAEIGRVVVDDILETSDAYRRGLRYGDQIIEFGGREIATANALQTVLGTFPRDWTTSLTFRREGETHRVVLRLPGVHDPAQLIEMMQEQETEQVEPPEKKPGEEKKPDGEQAPDAPKMPDIRDLLKKPEIPSVVKARYEEARGYANYWYNLQRQQELWNNYRGTAGLEQLDQQWRIQGDVANGSVEISLTKVRGEISMPTERSGALFSGDIAEQLSPPGSGGLLLTLHLWQRMLERGLDKFGECYYLGELPVGPDGAMADCLVGLHDGIEFRMLFEPVSGELVGLEMFPADDADPCVVHFSDFADVNGKRLPQRWVVRHGDKQFADIAVTSWEFGENASGNEEKTN